MHASDIQEADKLAAVRVGNWRWFIAPHWRVRSSSSFLKMPFEALETWPGADLIKENVPRSVWRIRLGRATVIAKVYASGPLAARTKTLFLGPPARREFRAALYAQGQQLSTVRPIACGRPSRGLLSGPYVLLTEEVPQATNLSAYWQDLQTLPQPQRRARTHSLITETARFLAELHDHSFLPQDLHADNVLIRCEEDALEPVLVDLHGARWGRSISPHRRAENLADLNQWFQRQASRTQRLRFLKTYLSLALGRPERSSIRDYSTRIQSLTDRNRRKLERKRDRRTLGDNRYFGLLSLSGGWTAHVYLQSRRALPGSRCSEVQLRKQDWQPALLATLNAHPTQRVALQQMRIGDHQLNTSVQSAANRPSELRKRWVRHHRKLNRHQPAALPLALLEKHRRGRLIESVLIMERNT